MRTGVKWVLLSLGLCAGLLLATTALGAQPDQAHALPERLDPRWMAAHVRADNSSSSSTAPAPRDPNPWAGWLYQSYQENRWNIYRTDTNGFYAQNLTNRDGADIMPHGLKGTNRFVYSAMYDGVYNIWQMDAATGVKTPLTGSDSQKLRPRWSPDGQSILYEAQVWDGYQVFVIDANGNNERMLTGVGTHNLMASWSPDGSEILFSSNRTGAFRIWIMNADGTNQRQLSTLPASSFHPLWSPDGRRILFSAAGPGGWLDLWVMDRDGSSPQLIYELGCQCDAIANDWSMDGQNILFNRVSYVIYQGQLYWDAADILKYRVFDGWVDTYTPNHREWYADWVSLDYTPPVTVVDPLPPFTAQSTPMTWESVDEESGVMWHYVYYRHSASEPWSRELVLHVDELDLSEVGLGPVEMRVVGVDLAENQAPFRRPATVETTVYMYRLDVAVTDNRGAPLWSGSVEVDRDLLGQEQRGHEHLLYSNGMGFHVLDVSVPGFGSLPGQLRNVYSNQYVHSAMPPPDDIVVNGGFELGRPGWTISPGVDTIGWTHSGNGALAFPSSVFPEQSTWQHFHYDLSAWSGENVTMTIGVEGTNFALIYTASQQVSIPADMRAPTLSLQVGHDQPGLVPTSRRGAVLIEDSGGAITKIPLFDFEIIKGIVVDEVSVGSATHNLIAEGPLLPYHALPGETVTVDVAIRNIGALSSPQSVATYTLPAGLTYVSASISPTVTTSDTLRFEVGDVMAGAVVPLTITATVDADVARGTVLSAELSAWSVLDERETVNNVRTINTFVGEMKYLPALLWLPPLE